MRMNGESSLFYELAEISGGYANVRSVGMISFVKDFDTTMSIEEDFTGNIVTKINVLIENADDVPPILVSCMCAVDPSLDFTTAFNLGMDVVEQAGRTEGYTHNGVKYVVFADGEYYFITISIADTHIDEEHKTLFDIIRKIHTTIETELVHDKFDAILDILDELKEYTRTHFADEENYMRQIGYDGLAKQEILHQKFIDKLNELDLDDVDDNQETYLYSFLEFLQNWLVSHILKVDMLIPSI